MKNYVIFSLLSLILLSASSLFALYPDVDPYPYKKKAVHAYLGITYGSMVSDTFGTYQGAERGTGNKDRYQALWNPSHLFNAYNSIIQIGIRFAENKNIFLNNFRLEFQYLNSSNQYSIIVNASKMKNTDNLSKNPIAGFEKLVNGTTVVLYYDLRFWSKVVYPYIGFGTGMGEIKYKNVDLVEYPNGAGERYVGNKRMPYGQLVLGIAYETKIIKSAFFFEYQGISTFSKIRLNPEFNGIDNMKDPTQDNDKKKQDAENTAQTNLEPLTKPKDARFLHHGIAFGIRLYFS